jgi:uncharacterized short protein YbdD (DUF466 family)
MSNYAREFQSGLRLGIEALRRACGGPDYESYVQHMRQHHPEQQPLDYANFFRERQKARYENGRTGCC